MTTDRETQLAMLDQLKRLGSLRALFESVVRRDPPVTDLRILALQTKAPSLMNKMIAQVTGSEYHAYDPRDAEHYYSYYTELYGLIWDAAHAEHESRRQSKRAKKLRVSVSIEDIRTFQDGYIAKHVRLKKGWKKACCKELGIGMDALNARLKENEGSSRG